MRLLRKSKPFWSVLSEYGIFSCIIRVPITFPPEKLRGVLLSAMCVPDLRGTQGMFSHYTTRTAERGREDRRRSASSSTREGDTIRAELIGPENPFRSERGRSEGPVRRSRSRTATAPTLQDRRREARACSMGEYTDWIQVSFRVGAGRQGARRVPVSAARAPSRSSSCT